MNKPSIIWISVVLFISGVAFLICASVGTSSDKVADNSSVVSKSTNSSGQLDSSAPSTAQIASVKTSASPSGNVPPGPGFSPVAHSLPPAQPVSAVAGHAVEYLGQFARASVRVDGRDYQLTPNQLGNFPRVLIQPKDLVHVQVAYPQGQTGDPVVVETEDGGNLDGRKTANITALDGQQNVQFNFQATSQPGIYHVALRNGPDVKVLSFWAGPEPEVRQ
jgi:hypothetical protein